MDLDETHQKELEHDSKFVERRWTFFTEEIIEERSLFNEVELDLVAKLPRLVNGSGI